MSRCAVFGQPVAHSLSPQIHAAFAAQFGRMLSYERIEVSDAAFAGEVAAFFRDGAAGANVTVPHKLRAFEWADACVGDALAAAAVNTLSLENGRHIGRNTDGLGLAADLSRLGVALAGARILLLGAGGAAQGVLPALLRARPERVLIANRTHARAEALAQQFGGVVKAVSLTQAISPHDVVINATSLGLAGTAALTDAALIDGAFCYDMSYGAAAHFHRWAGEQGASSADGLGMLVGQAAAAYEVWFSEAPDISPVLAELRKQIDAS